MTTISIHEEVLEVKRAHGLAGRIGDEDLKVIVRPSVRCGALRNTRPRSNIRTRSHVARQSATWQEMLIWRKM